MRIRALAASLIAIAFASTSHAADRSHKTANDWSGFYVGAHIGKAWGETGNSWRNNVTPWTPDGDISYSSAAGGLHTGYLWQFNSLVVGIEGDFSWASLKGDDSQFAGLVNAVEINDIGTVRGRLGVAYGPSLFYGTAGLAIGTFQKKDLTLGASRSHDLVGWVIGGGYEYAFGRGLRARVEYHYIDFGSVNSTLTVGGGYYDHRADDIRIHSVRAGLSYSF